MTNEEYEARARAAGWYTDPDEFDQWRHAAYEDVYWDACDIPERYLVTPTSV